MNINIWMGHLMEWPNIHPKLEQVFFTLANLWPADTLKITSLNRTHMHDKVLGGSGVHAVGPPWRAVDISIRTLDPNIANAQIEAERLTVVVNDIWVYDSTRPHLKVAIANPHGTGPHIHLQVHPNTKRRES